MNRRTKFLVVGFAVICLAYPGMAWLIGLRVETSLADREQQAMERFPGTVTLINRQYQRGVYGATEELTYGLDAAALRALGPLAATPAEAGVRVTVRNTIHHGPLPQFRTIGLATMSTQVALPAQISAQLQALLGGEPAIRIHSRLGWFGGITAVVASPDYQGHLADGTQIGWQGVDVTSSANASLSSTSIDATVSGFQFKSAKLRGELAGLHFEADLKRAFDVLYTGPVTFKIATIKWQPQSSAGESLIQGLTLGGAGAAQGDYYKSTAQFGADAVQVPGYSITRAVYDISFEHLHGPTLAALTKDMRRNSASAGVAPPPAAALDTVKDHVIELLVHEPVINLARIGFAMPQGELRLSATASAPGLKREDLTGPQPQTALMQHLNVLADLRIDAALLARLLAVSGKQDAVSAQIDAFEHQGYIKRDGTALTAHLTFAGGKIAVNGRPYPPTAAH
jgi:uncharacterized protein YdgA (DUF945 family)